MNYEQLEALVIDWANEKEILKKATPLAQANKTLEEVKELIHAINSLYLDGEMLHDAKGRYVGNFDAKAEIKDALGDILVTIIIGAEMQGLKLTDCLESAYNVIKNRTGKIINGQFVKDGN